MQRGPAGPALDVKSGLSLEVVTGKALQEMPHFVDISLSFFAVQDVKGMKGNVFFVVLTLQVKEIALRITGADDGEIEADTPLMEAGLTSNSVQVLV